MSVAPGEPTLRLGAAVGVTPTSWLRRLVPADGAVAVTDAELLVLIACNLLTTVGLAGDIARHLLHPDRLGNDFISGWHLVLYGGVASVGVWLGVGAVRRGPAFVLSAGTTALGFGLLSLGGLCDAAWHAVYGTEAAVEALVSPPHLVVFAGLAFLLASPVVVLWRRPARRLGTVGSLVVVVSLVSVVLVTSLFTGFLSPLAGGLSLQAGYVEPLVGESLQDYDQVRGLGIAVWTVAVLAAATALVVVRFRLVTGSWIVAHTCIGVPALVITDGQGVAGHDLVPLVVGFVLAGLVVEVVAVFAGRPTLGRAGAALACALSGSTLWATTFAALEVNGRLRWSPALTGGTVVLSVLVGASVAALVALPAPTGAALVDSPVGPRPA